MSNLDPAYLKAVKVAAANPDWVQVVMNGGPPCFHVEAERGQFCLRAQRWAGHESFHHFVSLQDLCKAISPEVEA